MGGHYMSIAPVCIAKNMRAIKGGWLSGWVVLKFTREG